MQISSGDVWIHELPKEHVLPWATLVACLVGVGEEFGGLAVLLYTR